MDNIISLIQLFVIGFTFGLSAPCIITCMPALFFYVSSKFENISAAILNISVLLLGRLLAYIFLGFLVGLSMQQVQGLFNMGGIHFIVLKWIASILIVLLGFSVWMSKATPTGLCAQVFDKNREQKKGLSYLFVLGFIIGVSPCPPLIALLFEMAIVVKTPMQGMLFLSAFGFGTLISGLLVFGVMNGVFKFVADKTLFQKPQFREMYRRISAIGLVLFGLFVVLK